MVYWALKKKKKKKKKKRERERGRERKKKKEKKKEKKRRLLSVTAASERPLLSGIKFGCLNADKTESIL